MIKHYCDMCGVENASYVAPRWEGENNGQKVIITLNDSNVRDGLGWPLELCFTCLLSILSIGKWESGEAGV